LLSSCGGINQLTTLYADGGLTLTSYEIKQIQFKVFCIVQSQPLIIPRVKPIAVLPVSRIPRFASVVDVIGKIDAAKVELLPKIV
jgi:hypothetical protein